MRNPPPRQSTYWTTAAVCGVAMALFFSPAWIQGPLRAAVIDVVVSGQSLAVDRFESWRKSACGIAAIDKTPARSGDAAQTQDRFRELESQCRRMRIENARLREELALAEKYGVSPLPVATGRQAQAPTLLRVAVVSGETMARWSSLQHLNQGRTQGVTESSLVLDEGQPHVNQGSDAGIEPELDVLVGRCVVGRIASVGRWTSTIELVTDPRYRALAQIVRPSEGGGTFGTEGILVGQGAGRCKLNDVPTTQSVRVGDEVYTSDRDGRSPVPLYYGRIIRVEESGRQWDITVEPAVKANDLTSVAVLKVPPILGRRLAE